MLNIIKHEIKRSVNPDQAIADIDHLYNYLFSHFPDEMAALTLPLSRECAVMQAVSLLEQYKPILDKQKAIQAAEKKERTEAFKDVKPVWKIIYKAFESYPSYYRPSFVSGDKNSQLINITFITPRIAERFNELLDQLEDQTDWTIETNYIEPNEKQVRQILKHLLKCDNVLCRQAHEYKADIARWFVYPQAVLAPRKEERIVAQFEEMTGMIVEFVYTRELMDKYEVERERQRVIGRMMAMAE